MSSIINESNRHLFNPNNERITKKYKEHRRNAFGADDKTLDSLHKAIRSFEILTDFVDFTKFNRDVANVFMGKIRNMELSESYLLRITMDIKHFIQWLANEPDGKKVRYNDADFLNLTRNELSAARTEGYKESHDYQTLLYVVRNMPDKTIIDRRNRVLFSMQVLGSFRTNELRNFPIGIIKYDKQSKIYFIDINPRKVRGVKFRKARQATLFNVPDLIQWIIDWIEELKTTENFTDIDPIFPSIKNTFAKNLMFSRAVQKTAISPQSVRKIFNEAFRNAGVEPLRVHSIRQTRSRYIGNLTNDVKTVALQQDFGHKSIGTTMHNYGNITHERQRELMAQVKIDTEG
ncbi:MAG: site-specific integrase [Rickettsiales bacterium]|jgi:integrase|nr:site-specific integrase [Rickettsiales bacterium]